MDLNRLFPLLGFALLTGCLQVEDHVQLRSDGQVSWSIRIAGDVEGWEDMLVSAGAEHVAESSGIWHMQRTFMRPSSVDSLDSLGVLGPLLQRMDWHRDSVGYMHWSRTIRVQRDLPGEDGSYADRMLAEMYRGRTCSFSVQFPGRIAQVGPTPDRIDSLQGQAHWTLPLAQFVQGQAQFHATIEPIPVEPTLQAVTQKRFLIGVGMVLFLLIGLAHIFRKKHGP